MLGGRCAEEVVFGDLTTGAESDIQQLTRIARFMVGRWGMSQAIGPIAVLPSESSSFLLPGASETSEETQRLIDQEVHRIVDTAHREVLELLHAKRSNLDDLVSALLKAETLDEADAYAAAGLTRSSADEAESAAGAATV
jgi:cell division protease FtsH